MADLKPLAEAARRQHTVSLGRATRDESCGPKSGTDALQSELDDLRRRIADLERQVARLVPIGGLS